MKEFLNGDTLINTVAMYLDVSPDDVAVVMEGEDDVLTVRDFVGRGVKLFPGVGGKLQVLRAARLANSRGVSRARFVVDRDYDAFVGATETDLPNVIASEYHDCFVDILVADSRIIERVVGQELSVASRAPGASPRKAELATTRSIVQRGFELATMLATVRIIDGRRALGLDFKRFSFHTHPIDELDVRLIVTELAERCNVDDLALEGALAEISTTSAEVTGLDFPPVGDHDLLAAVSRVLKCHGVSIKADFIRRLVIMGINSSSLLATNWCQDLEKWCVNLGLNSFVTRDAVLVA